MILAIDTSTQYLGIALYDGNQVLSERIWKSQRRHTAELASVVKEMLEECGVQIQQLNTLAVALGPGSFTSLRIGVVFAKGLCLALHLPIIGIPSLDILAYSQPLQQLPLICALLVGRKKFAAQDYINEGGKWVSHTAIRLINVQELEQQISCPSIVCGEFNEEERRIMCRKWKTIILSSPANSIRRPSFLAEMAWEQWQTNSIGDVVTLSPIYLHTVDSIPN